MTIRNGEARLEPGSGAANTSTPASNPIPASTPPQAAAGARLTPHHLLTTLIPKLSAGDFAALKKNIAEYGIRDPIWVKEEKIIDGRQRHRACKELGIECPTRELAGDDVLSLIASANIHRRHLTRRQKQAVIKKLLRMNPGDSNRSIAKLAGGDGKTVGTLRADLQASAEIPQLTMTVGADGKVRPATAKSVTPRPASSSTFEQVRHLFARLPPDQLERLLIEVIGWLPAPARERLGAHLASAVTVH
jgi:hypothetical protein